MACCFPRFIEVLAGVVVVLSRFSDAYSSGSSVEACVDMLLQHGGSSPQNSPSPYEIAVAKAGELFFVTLNDASGVRPFRNFFVQARHIATSTLTGEFYDLKTTEAKLITCLDDSKSVTHADSSPKHSVQFSWKSLGVSLNDVYFVATFVHDNATFWTNVRSVELASLVDNVCSTFELVTRSEWNARPPTSISYIDPPVNMTFVHHTAGRPCSDKDYCKTIVRGIQDYHMDHNGWSDIGYSFLIGEDGRVYEGRGWNVVGAHTSGYNNVAFGFSVMGDFMLSLPNSMAQTALKNIIACGVQLGYITDDYELFGHRDGRCTLCPGDELYLEIRTWPHYSFRDIPIVC